MASPLPKLSRLVVYTSRYTKLIEREYERRVQRAAEVIRAKIRKNISRGGQGRHSKPGEYPRRQSGKLMRGVKTRPGRRSNLTFTVYNTMFYGDYLEYGTRGGKIIVPKRARVLSWRSWSGRKKVRVYATRVRQGAIRDRSFQRRTMVENRAVLKAIFSRALPDRVPRPTTRIG